MASDKNDKPKKEYNFGGIKQYDLEEIESEVLNESIYLDVFAGSDVRFKTDISSVDEDTNKLLHLNAYKYSYKRDEFPKENFPKGEQVGVLAQEVEAEYPDLVKQNELGYRYVNYSKLSVMLLQGMKDLQKTVKEQEQEIRELKKNIKALK